MAITKGSCLLLAIAFVCLTQTAWAMQAPEFVEVNEFLPSGPVYAATDASYMLDSKDQAEEAVYNELMRGVTISDDNQMLETSTVKPAPARAVERPDVVLVESAQRDQSTAHGQADVEGMTEAEARQRGIWGAIKSAGAKAINQGIKSGVNSLKNSANKFMDKIFGNADKAKAKAKSKVKKAGKKLKKGGGGKNDMPKIFKGAYKKVQGMYKKKDVQKLTAAFTHNHSDKSSTNIGERAVDTSVAADNIGIKALAASQGMDDQTDRWKAPPAYHKALPFPTAQRQSPSDRYNAVKAGVLSEADLPNI